jgi:hypothetical protein
MLGRVRVAATWNAWTPGGGLKKGIWVMSWGTFSQIGIFPWGGGNPGQVVQWCSQGTPEVIVLRLVEL